LLERGIFIPAIRYPTVARGKARLRLTLSAAHTDADLAQLLTALKSPGFGL
jgi:7-keto-8-aminopelargonate synthetase-like enzyme